MPMQSYVELQLLIFFSTLVLVMRQGPARQVTGACLNFYVTLLYIPFAHKLM